MGMWEPALCLHPFGVALEENTHSFHCIASSTEKPTMPGEEPKRSTTRLLPLPLRREGKEHGHQCLGMLAQLYDGQKCADISQPSHK